jgi:carboxybiotin decarboxylase
MNIVFEFLHAGALGNMTWGNLVMIAVGLFFIYLAITKDYEPLLLVPIGFGILVGNIPFQAGMNLGVYEEGSVLSIIYQGVRYGWYPPLIFLGIGAMTDFSSMLSNPRLILLGAAAQTGIFFTFIGALWMGFDLRHAAAIGIIGGADGPTAIFLSSQMAPDYLGAIAIAAYSYMALVPVIQPPIIRLLTSREERLIRMKPSRPVSTRLRILFPIVAFLLTAFIAPGSIPLLGMLFFGNLLKESGVTERLAKTARSAFIDTITILLGFAVGTSTDASRFVNPESLKIFALGAAAFGVATAAGVLFAKLMNVFSREKSIRSSERRGSRPCPIRRGSVRWCVPKRTRKILSSCMPWPPTWPG